MPKNLRVSEEEAEDYSRFLYQLEQKKDITENERKSLYRYLSYGTIQIEREDGAAVGAGKYRRRIAIFHTPWQLPGAEEPPIGLESVG